jgi:hypothetical protein
MTRSGLHRDPAGTLVEHGYAGGYARMPLPTIWLPGFPRRIRPAMARSPANLAIIASERQRRGLPTATGGENRS